MRIFVHVDADPDSFDASLTKAPRRNCQEDCLDWNGLTSTLNYFQELAGKIGAIGLSFKATFFLRADEQIRGLYGAFSDIFQRFHDKVHRPFSVGWHPHLLRWSESSKCWHQEFQGVEWMHRILTDCHRDLASQGYNVKYAKMGWCFHNDTTMKTLSDLRVDADFTALPGIKRPGGLTNNASFQDRYDWSRTRALPYHPSELDYQRFGNLRILEIPLTTFRICSVREFLYTALLALSAYRRFDFSYFPPFRTTVPLFLLNLKSSRDIEQTCERLFSQRKRDYSTIYLHPDNLLNASGKRMLESFLLKLVSTADRHNEKISFVDASELYDFCKEHLTEVKG
jgi:hypothetical protein